MTPEIIAYRDLACRIVEGQAIDPRQKSAVLSAAAKSETDLQQSVALLSHRRLCWVSLEAMTHQKPELERIGKLLKSRRGIMGSTPESEAYERVSAKFAVQWEECRSELVHTADRELLEAVSANVGNADHEQIKESLFDWKNGQLA